MFPGGRGRADSPPDDRPAALLGALRRGALLVFLPVALAGQTLAWVAYAITGVFRPWSWVKIGFAYALASVRVPFEVTELDRATGATPSPQLMLVALGALTVAVVVLAFRAGRDQAEGLERRPAAALAGAAVGLGFAVPCLLIALPVRLAFPGAAVALVRPVPWGAFVMPLAVVGPVAVAGAVWAGREHLAETRWGGRLVSALRGGATAVGWGLGLAFLGFLVLAVIEMDATRAYGRAVGEGGGGGAMVVVHHALLLPNQSAMVLAMAMGAPVELLAGGEGVTVTLTGIDLAGDGLVFLGALFGGAGADDAHVDLPPWYLAFAVIPLVATIAGGRRAGEGAGPPRERALVGALAGIVYALGVSLTAWFATIVIPILATVFGGATRLGPDFGATLVLSLASGIGGGALGALVSPSRPR